MLADYTFADARDHDVSDVVFVLSLVAPPYILGRIARRLADQKELLEERQELIRREAVRNERDRIAREMHDVIAHSISAMVVQTAAAQDLVHQDPDRAERVLADVADTGRRAIAETGRLLHVLRDDADELGLEPAPGLADLAGLVAAFRASGLDHRSRGARDAAAAVRGRRRLGVPDRAGGADQRAEVRHATRRRGCAWPRPRTLCRSRPPTRAADGAGPAAGLGLVGIAERVALLGGQLSHGVRDGRFELTASLPVAP